MGWLLPSGTPLSSAETQVPAITPLQPAGTLRKGPFENQRARGTLARAKSIEIDTVRLRPDLQGGDLQVHWPAADGDGVLGREAQDDHRLKLVIPFREVA